MSRTEQYDLSDEDRERILTNTIISGPVKHVKADETIDQIQQKQEELKRQQRRDKIVGRQWQNARQIEANLEKARIDTITMGRSELIKPELIDTQCLWSDTVCDFCGKDCKKLMEGWAGWAIGKPNAPLRNTLYEPDTVNESLNYTVRHQCEQTTEVQARQISYLINEVAKLKVELPKLVRDMIVMNQVGR